MANPPTPTCPQCTSWDTYHTTDMSVVGTWKKVSLLWRCAKCLHEWPARENELHNLMDASTPTCPECTGDNVYSVTMEKDGKQTWHCGTCKHQWPASEDTPLDKEA
jgi:transposase-like protein